MLATAHLRLPFTRIGTVLSIDIDGAPTRAVVARSSILTGRG
ncbi:hypothetical protein MES5069_750126 [Mesorhizobium escarrei]|uniref:Uncharacterized protein n=1 Tax=Mesorhizobium escarrei TaxID=666018 RepID=A0ABN8KH86_9HYPH|nr:hypothetical protein MES5069_750126 [Mesorhizobium escarrei]